MPLSMAGRFSWENEQAEIRAAAVPAADPEPEPEPVPEVPAEVPAEPVKEPVRPVPAKPAAPAGG